MNSTNVILIILGVELGVTAILLLLIIFHRLYLFVHKKRSRFEKRKLSKLILASLIQREPVSSRLKFCRYCSPLGLLNVVEGFDRRFSGNDWKELKRHVSAVYLLPRARRWAKKRSWLKRNYAARCFSLAQFPKDETAVFELIRDPVFLVRSIAVQYMVKLQVREGIREMILWMSRRKDYTYYFYRDILIHGSIKIYEWIEQFAAEEEERRFHLACLDILRSVILHLEILDLRKEAASSNAEVRLAAIRIYANNPQPESESELLKALDDPHAGIRAEAAYGLRYFYGRATVDRLVKALSDPDWKVRINSAMALKEFGNPGEEVLRGIDKNEDMNAYGAALYALES